MKVGDLVRTIEGWSYKTWTGIVVGMEASEEWAKVLWTEVSTTDGQISRVAGACGRVDNERR